ncbi:MAG TPA: DUF6351 family protein [Vicinamibacterales bacterium]
MKIISAAIALFAFASFAHAQSSNNGFEIKTISTRPDFVSGGDVLVQVTVPATIASDKVAIAVNGRDVAGDFKLAPPLAPSEARGPRRSEGSTFVGLVKDLSEGKSEIEAGVKGQKISVTLGLTNHPISGPVMGGPHQSPFICETQSFGFGQPLDADCRVATRVEYFYRSNAAPSGPSPSAVQPGADVPQAQQQQPNPFKPYNPSGPKPADIAMTTTLDGKTVPYIVRREMGTINRAVYAIAFLHEPGTPLPTPWAQTGSGWNGRLIYSFGPGCQAGYHQGRNLGGLAGNRSFLEETQFGDYGIAKGYALASSSLNAFGTNCADVISVETMMMVKEHFIEEFGTPRWTIGSGRSGGSMQQHLIANNYPGLLDGLIPTAAFADTITFMNHLFDCELLDHAFKTSSIAWTDEQKAAVSGEANWQYCTRNGTAYPLLRVNNCDRMSIPADLVYDPTTNPKGARCTYQDNLVNVFGRDPQTGFARRPFDNVGIQYGLRAFNERQISFEQFVDLNTRIGGHDIDGNVVAARTAADPDALRIAYQSGRVNDAGKGMAMVPMIDVRPYTEGTGDVHDTVNTHITRARLVAANGTSANQVLHTYEPGTPIQRVQQANLDEIEQWVASIANDRAPAKTQLEKVIRNKPAGVSDACYTKDGQKITDMRRCAQMFPVYSNPRLSAGLPMGATMLKCELKGVDRKDYTQALTDAQVASLKAAFPGGVCDYGRKGVSVRAPDTWLSYGDGASTTTH